jgi:hypothetical protein
MDRINAYTTPSPNGVRVDTEGMLVDLITVCKAAGVSKEEFRVWVAETFDRVEVNISIPKDQQN